MSRLMVTVALLPRNACVVVLRIYRAVVSPLYGEVCRYHPSCSRYALEAIQQYGVVRGSAMGVWRIGRCNPWSAGGIDDVPVRDRTYPLSRFGFVLAPAGTSDTSGTSGTSGPAMAARRAATLRSTDSPAPQFPLARKA